MTDHPQRRSSDFAPDDHDILIELRRDVANLMKMVDGKMGDFAMGLAALRTETSTAHKGHDERLTSLETWRNRVDGAAFVGKEAMVLAFAAGGFVVGTVTLVLRATGHL